MIVRRRDPARRIMSHKVDGVTESQHDTTDPDASCDRKLCRRRLGPGRSCSLRARFRRHRPEQADTFEKNMFMRPPGDKASACFMRRYDADHVARHPKQKVAAMKLLVSTETTEGETRLSYAFHLGVSFRRRAGDFESS